MTNLQPPQNPSPRNPTRFKITVEAELAVPYRITLPHVDEEEAVRNMVVALLAEKVWPELPPAVEVSVFNVRAEDVTDERCPECGQPDNCGDCTHEAAGGSS